MPLSVRQYPHYITKALENQELLSECIGSIFELPRCVSAVAAENENESDDYDPNAIIVKKIAQAVIHISEPP